MKIIEILQGFRNLIFGNPSVKKLADKRMKICAECEFASQKIYLHCSRCGCYIPAKARSPESECPENFWEKIKSEE